MSSFKTLSLTVLLTNSLALAGTYGCVSSAPEPILSGQPTPKFVAPDVDSVYIAVQTHDGTSISRFDRREQRLEPLTVVPDAMQQFAVHDDYLYWLRKQQPSGDKQQPVIMRLSKSKPVKPEPAVTSRQPVTSFRFDATHLYWTQGGSPNDPDETQTPGLLRVMNIGSTPTNFVTKQPSTPYSLALGGAFVFWVTKLPDGRFEIRTLRKGSHEQPRALYAIPSVRTDDQPPPLAADDTGVFVLTRSSVLHVDQDNGQVHKVSPPIHPMMDVLALDVHYLYFNADERGFVRLPTAGGPTQVLLSSPVPFATLDDRFVYWTTRDSVVRMPKQP